ncbi:enoyl-CoA hydratase/isomerase family protein [Nakamurella endophytica]|uniref:3-hydroxyisobutyryl-CoA hydrolase n=1 Tax=Nakamurella endophytica TaxID=1748367 RepID=A0A917SYR2_9ACTN|nr:enoyl-CoA hydratase/isomerase family protein [Nakamurella endophytica]GGM04751.1 3-hydroxyisobutyryl-CoA hydrolase [Nakamurella endophytica]
MSDRDGAGGTATPAAPPVLARVEGRLGHLTLNRPSRINALDIPTVRAVLQALDAWEDDPTVAVVLVDGAGDRGLCAGGDLRAMASGLSGDGPRAEDFLAVEYRMNARLAHYRTPVVAFMDGIVLGGGVGISAHCGVRVVTERSVVGMPETAIGICPDVGSLHLLARAPGRLGAHLALTGARLDGPGAVHAGLADHLVTSGDLASVTARLRDGVVPELPVPPPSPHPSWIDECYAADTVAGVLDRLRAHPDPAAAEAARTLAAMSPTACVATLEALRRAATLTLDEVLAQDLAVCSRLFHEPDFAEGVRAVIVDKDRDPHWRPATLDAVDRDRVLSFFDPVDAAAPGPAPRG